MLSISSVQPDFFPKADNLFQSHLWGSFKEILGQKALYFRVVFNDYDGNEVAYPLLILLRKIKGQFVYAYVQRAPNENVIPSDKTGFLEELSLALKEQLPPSILFIRYDLQWINQEPFAWTEILEIMMNSACKTDIFSRIVSASGSLWFPGFEEYVKSHNFIKKPDCIYLSLGDTEAKAENKILATVQDKTESLFELYKSLEIPVIFELNKGNHFTESALRTAKGIKWILER